MTQPQQSQQTQQDLRPLEAVVAKATMEPEFRASLLADPHAALTALGFSLRDDVTVHVYQNDDRTLHVVLPPPDRIKKELDDNELGKVSGGFLGMLFGAGGWGGELFDEMLDGNTQFGTATTITNVNSGNWTLIRIGTINVSSF